MTDAPVDLDELEAECRRRLEHAGKFRNFIPFMNIDARQLSALIAELRAARALLADGVDPVLLREALDAPARVVPELARLIRDRASRAAPPADEVAGLLQAVKLVRFALDESRLEYQFSPQAVHFEALDRIEHHLKGKR